MEEKLEAIVLKQADNKENDVVLSLATKKGVIDVVAKAVKKIGAKNKAACQLFVLSEFLLTYRNEKNRGVVTTATVIKDYRLSGDLLAIAIMSLVADILSMHFRKEDFFDDVLDLARNLSEKVEEYWLDFCWLIKKWIEKSGVAPHVDGCHKCQNKMVVAISLAGGYVCKNCVSSYDLHFNKEKLKLFRYLFKAQGDNKEVLYKLDYDYSIAEFLMNYYFYHQPTNLKSWEFLQHLVTMQL